MEGPELCVSPSLLIQVPLLYLDCSDGVSSLLLCLQIGDLPHQDLSSHHAISNSISSLTEATIELTISAELDIAHSCTVSILITDSILSRNMAVCDTKDPVTGFAILAKILMEPKSESALAISLVQVLGGEWNTMKRGEEVVNIASDIQAVNGGQEGGIC